MSRKTGLMVTESSGFFLSGKLLLLVFDRMPMTSRCALARVLRTFTLVFQLLPEGPEGRVVPRATVSPSPDAVFGRL